MLALIYHLEDMLRVFGRRTVDWGDQKPGASLFFECPHVWAVRAIDAQQDTGCTVQHVQQRAGPSLASDGSIHARKRANNNSNGRRSNSSNYTTLTAHPGTDSSESNGRKTCLNPCAFPAMWGSRKTMRHGIVLPPEMQPLKSQTLSRTGVEKIKASKSDHQP